MHLHELQPGQSGKILSIDSQELEHQLMRLGVLRGDTIRVTDLAPFKGPIALQCNHTKVAVRWSDAQRIKLEVPHGA